ncbi:MAG: PKD domain-containing protein [Verrucomicrobiia bacterium]
MDDDAALLYGVSLDLHTCRSNVVTASSGVDGLNRLIPANPEEYPFAPQRATMRRAIFTSVLFGIVLVGREGQTFAQTSPNQATIVSTLPAASAFTNVYGIYGTNFITIAPWTSQGIFYQGDAVTISNRIGTTIEVYDFHSNHVTNHAPPVTLTNLPMGHYFVQVDGANGGFGDRSMFSVWPKGYTNYLHSDIGSFYTPGTFGESNRFARLAIGVCRSGWSAWGSEDWCGNILWFTGGPNTTNLVPPFVGLINTNGNVSDTNAYLWTLYDQFVNGGGPLYRGLWANGNLSDSNGGGGVTQWPNPPAAKGIIIETGHITNDCLNYYAPFVDDTNSLSSWVHEVAITWSNIAVRYGTNCFYEILNEPAYPTLAFTTNQGNPYGMITNNPDVTEYPASLAVSAACSVIHYVCPSCQVKAPNTWFDAAHISMVTNRFVVQGYTNVSEITWHDGSMLWGPMDSTCIYTDAPFYVVLSVDAYNRIVTGIYHKPYYITEWYPASPDVMGKTNGWWVSSPQEWGRSGGTNFNPKSWGWYVMNMRWWKDIILNESTGCKGIQGWQITDGGGRIPAGDNLTDYAGWNHNSEHDDIYGCGPRPTVDGQAMLSWWLTGGTPLANWLSGNPLVCIDMMGSYSNGPPGLHFWEWQFADGTTNTFVWSDEMVTVTTNFGVGLTDIFSNQWNGPIGMEPVIAWGWPNNRLGGTFSIVPVAAFNASPTYGPAPMTVTFTDGSAGAITNRSWQFGDGFVTNTSEITVVHRYTGPGSNTVQLVVSGPSGASSKAQSNMVIVTPVSPPQNGGGRNGLPPGLGGTTGGNTGGTNNVPPADGGANSNWRLLITY